MKKYCKDCKKELAKSSKYTHSKRCHSCVMKYLLKNNSKLINYLKNKTKEHNPAFIDGRTLIKHYCINCKTKEISYNTWSYGNKRCLSCARKGKNHPMFGVHRFGKDSPNFIDGRSFEPYSSEFNDQLKDSIRKRDNYECQNCSMTEEEYLIVIGFNLAVHHIDYNKDNCNKNNLITLCNQCNSRANSNRDYWQEFYQNKINIILTENGGITNGRI
jgi:hypothetical protein